VQSGRGRPNSRLRRTSSRAARNQSFVKSAKQDFVDREGDQGSASQALDRAGDRLNIRLPPPAAKSLRHLLAGMNDRLVTRSSPRSNGLVLLSVRSRCLFRWVAKQGLPVAGLSGFHPARVSLRVASRPALGAAERTSCTSILIRLGESRRHWVSKNLPLAVLAEHVAFRLVARHSETTLQRRATWPANQLPLPMP
jgi:hypothetical protein